MNKSVKLEVNPDPSASADVRPAPAPPDAAKKPSRFMRWLDILTTPKAMRYGKIRKLLSEEYGS